MSIPRSMIDTRRLFCCFVVIAIVSLQAQASAIHPPQPGPGQTYLGTSGSSASREDRLFDYNDLLNRHLDIDIFSTLGAYGVRYSVASDDPSPPPGCKTLVVNSLERHGARLMTTNALDSAQKTIHKIQVKTDGIDINALPAEVRFLKSVSLLRDSNSLVPFGALQAYYSGKSTAAVFPRLRHLKPFVRASGDAAMQDDRVILSSQYWLHGFLGGDFPAETLQTQEDVRKAASSLPLPDVILSEMAGANNTLDVSTCVGEDKLPDSVGEKGAQANFSQSTIMSSAGSRLMSRFISSGVEDLQLSATDVLNLASLCSFDTLGRALVTSGGHLSLNQSEFCGIFNKTEWNIIGYAFDVGKWRGHAYGNPFHRAIATGFLRELSSRFTGIKPLLENPTSLNATIDGDEATFPLPNEERGPAIYFDGSHDNNIAPIVAALGLFDGPALGTEHDAQDKPHNWTFSHIAPLQGKIVFEKLICESTRSQSSGEYVRVRANSAILRSWCSNASSDGLCPLQTFLEKIDFAQGDSQWQKCFSS